MLEAVGGGWGGGGMVEEIIKADNEDLMVRLQRR